MSSKTFLTQRAINYIDNQPILSCGDLMFPTQVGELIKAQISSKKNFWN